MIVTGGVDNNFIAQSSTLSLNSVTGEWATLPQTALLPTISNHTMDVVMESSVPAELRGGYDGTMRMVAFGGFQAGAVSSRAWIMSVKLHPINGRTVNDMMLTFDGVLDYAIVADFVNLSNEATIAFWMNSGGFEVESQAIMSIGQIGMGIQILQCLHAGTICLYVEGAQMLFGRTKVNDGLWHHVAVTFSVSSGSMSIYIDGKEDAAIIDSMRVPIFGSDSNFIIGRGGLNSVSHFPGALDDIFVWRAALSSAQVTALASGQVNTPPHVHWTFDVSAVPVMQQNMFPSVERNYIMYCGGVSGSFGRCPGTARSSAPLRAGLAQNQITTDGWLALALADSSPEPPARHSHAAAAVSGNRLLIHGGLGPDGGVFDDLWLGSVILGKLISWMQLFQPQTFGLFAHSLISHFDLPENDLHQTVTIVSRDSDSTCNVDIGSCRSFRFIFLPFCTSFPQHLFCFSHPDSHFHFAAWMRISWALAQVHAQCPSQTAPAPMPPSQMIYTVSEAAPCHQLLKTIFGVLSLMDRGTKFFQVQRMLTCALLGLKLYPKWIQYRRNGTATLS